MLAEQVGQPSPWWQRALLGAFTIGALFGGYAAVSATQGDSASPSARSTVVEIAGPISERADIKPVIAPTTGREPAVLSSCISALASAPSAAIQVFNGGVITLYKQGDRVCTRLEQTDLSSFSCYDEITIRSGLAYSLLQARDNLYLLGLVPDDASAVTVNGKPVTLDHNIWHTSDKVGTQLSVTIYDDEGHAVASLGSNGS